jgi:hypothetical protein
MLRRRLRDVDQTAPLYEDGTLWEYVGDRLTYFQVRKVAGTAGLSVTTAGTSAGVDQAPVEDALGVLVVVATAAVLLRDLYTDKVQRGEFGVTWKSGLEQESTVDARKAYEGALDALDREVQQLTLIRASTTSATRVQ